MNIRRKLAAGVVLPALIAAPSVVMAQNHTGADGMPTGHSTPTEQAQTQRLNRDISNNNSAVDQKNDANNAQYQEKMGEYATQKENYDAQMTTYAALRDRYRAERAAYHRAVWPHPYKDQIVESDRGLMDARVQTVSGAQVGTVNAIARMPDGGVEGLRIALDNGGTAWLDSSDVRFDHDARVVMTNLDRDDLNLMAAENP
jgi:hypothetical protein